MLTVEILRSELWKTIERDLRQRLTELREINDRDHTPTRTSEIRGQISEVKRMLALGHRPSAGTEEHPE